MRTNFIEIRMPIEKTGKNSLKHIMKIENTLEKQELIDGWSNEMVIEPNGKISEHEAHLWEVLIEHKEKVFDILEPTGINYSVIEAKDSHLSTIDPLFFENVPDMPKEELKEYLMKRVKESFDNDKTKE